MKPRFILFRRAEVFYCEDTQTRKQTSLRTRDKDEALRLLHAKNEAEKQPAINLQIARAYLAASDPQVATRNWQLVMDEAAKFKGGPTGERWARAMRDTAFDALRELPVLETRAAHFLRVLETGTVCTNIFLRRLQNFALDMNWLPWPILPKKRWPKIQFKEKRAITWEEQQKILAGENNPEWRAYYHLLWHLGGAQSDVANLKAADVDWQMKVISFNRMKTGSVVQLHIGKTLESILNDLPGEGLLVPAIAKMHEKDRAKQFMRRCRLVGVSGISLHSYRYAWAERAREAGYPERFAQEALGHKSGAVHRAYAKKAKVRIPALEEYEQANRHRAGQTV